MWSTKLVRASSSASDVNKGISPIGTNWMSGRDLMAIRRACASERKMHLFRLKSRATTLRTWLLAGPEFPSIRWKKKRLRNCCGSKSSFISASSRSVRQSLRSLVRFVDREPDSRIRYVRLARSCFLVQPVSVKLKWPGRSRPFCSAVSARWFVSTCRSSWRSIPSPNWLVRRRVT